MIQMTTLAIIVAFIVAIYAMVCVYRWAVSQPSPHGPGRCEWCGHQAEGVFCSQECDDAERQVFQP